MDIYTWYLLKIFENQNWASSTQPHVWNNTMGDNTVDLPIKWLLANVDTLKIVKYWTVYEP